MSQWTFVAAAYAVTLIAITALLLWSYSSMRKAEAAAEQLRRDR